MQKAIKEVSEIKQIFPRNAFGKTHLGFSPQEPHKYQEIERVQESVT